jgi:hypothetical protein
MSSDADAQEAPSAVAALLNESSAEVRQVVEATYGIEMTNLHMGSPPSKQIIADIVSAIQGIVT